MDSHLTDWLHCGYGLVGLTGLVVTGEGIRKYLGWPGETTRQMIHVGTGFVAALAPFAIASPLPVILIGLSFALFNFVAIRQEWLKGMHATERKTYGTVYYPIAFAILAWMFWGESRWIFATSMLVMAIADPVAAIVGRLARRPRYFNWWGDRKSLQGSTAMALTSSLVIYLLGGWSGVLDKGGTMLLTMAIIGGVLAAVGEGLSNKGSDNLSVPVIVAAVMVFFEHASQEWITQMSIGLILSAATAIVSHRVGALNGGGAAVSFLMGTVIFGLGGWAWALPILVFFVTSSSLSSLKRRTKQRAESVYEKSSRRDIGQVLANGGVATAILLVGILSGVRDWYVVYLAVLAAVNADTWATEIGTIFAGRPRLITTMRRVDNGTSGAISVPGTLAAWVGSLLVATTGVALRPEISTETFVWISLAGLGGSMIDSLLGATIQIQYVCSTCARQVERVEHCGLPTRVFRGWPGVNNDAVNVLSSLAGGAIVYWAGGF